MLIILSRCNFKLPTCIGKFLRFFEQFFRIWKVFLGILEEGERVGKRIPDFVIVSLCYRVLHVRFQAFGRILCWTRRFTASFGRWTPSEPDRTFAAKFGISAASRVIRDLALFFSLNSILLGRIVFFLQKQPAEFAANSAAVSWNMTRHCEIGSIPEVTTGTSPKALY